MADSNHETADASGTPRPLRSILLEALQAVAGDCEALRSITGGPRGSGNLAGAMALHAANCLGSLWRHLDDAQRAITAFPRWPAALQDLSDGIGKPWDLATRRTLVKIAKPIQATRPWYEATLHDDQDRRAAEWRPMVTAWETADFSTWPALLEELQERVDDLLGTIGREYGGAVDALQPQDTPQDTQAGPVDKRQDAADGGDGMTWQEARDMADERRLRGERFTSYPKLAKVVGCSAATLHKAIKENGSVELQEWASKQRGASRLNAAPEVAAVTFDSTPQRREPDPADITEDGDVDAAMAYLLDQAGPDERARINAMNPAQRRRLAETVYRDPDKEEQALRHWQAEHSGQD